MVDAGLLSGFVNFSMGLIEIGVLVHPHSEMLCGAALPGGLLFSRKTSLLRRNIVLNICSMIFHEHGPKLLLTRGTTVKTGILTLLEFWWVP